MRRGGVEGYNAEAQKHSLGLIAVTCLSDANCNTAQQGLSRLKETCLQSVTWMDKQCRVLTSANKKQSCRSCLHTPAPMIDLQASTQRCRAAMHSLDRCYHALYSCGKKGPFSRISTGWGPILSTAALISTSKFGYIDQCPVSAMTWLDKLQKNMLTFPDDKRVMRLPAFGPCFYLFQTAYSRSRENGVWEGSEWLWYHSPF